MRLTKDILVEDIEPCGYHVVLELLDVYQTDDNGDIKSEGGIILDKKEVKREALTTQIGKVLKVGNHAHKNLECGVDSHSEWGYEVGDLVSFNAYVGKKISSDPEDRRVLVVDHDIKVKVKLKEN